VGKLMDDVVDAGGDGFIVVDLPPDEGRCVFPLMDKEG